MNNDDTDYFETLVWFALAVALWPLTLLQLVFTRHYIGGDLPPKPSWWSGW